MHIISQHNFFSYRLLVGAPKKVITEDGDGNTLSQPIGGGLFRCNAKSIDDCSLIVNKGCKYNFNFFLLL